MTNELKNIPDLRFPEFDREWEEMKLGDIGKVAMNKRIYKKQTSPYEEIPFYKIGTFGKKSDTFISRNTYEEYKTKFPYPKVGDILISASGSIGRTIEYKGQEAYYQDSNIVWLDHDDRVTNSFLKQYYSIIKWNGVEGTTIKRLYNKNIVNTKIKLPDINEQVKIGTFFSKLDRQIELEEQKLEKLKEQKKGYMQKIFSQEIRFKDDNGNDYPEWESKKFLDIFKLAPSKNNQIKSSEVVENGIIPVVDQGKDIFLGYSNEKDKAIEDFDNVIVYGDHTTIIKYIKEPFIIGGDGVKLLESNDGSLIHYLYILLQYFNVKPEGYKRHYSILKNKMMNISNTKEEQEKIGDFFNELDELIEKQSSKIVVLKQRKKGFLQKMFV